MLQFAFMPVIASWRAISHADEATVRATVRELPALLDQVDALIADGTIGGPEPNAADFQILASMRVLLEFEDLGASARGPCVRPRRAAALSRAGPGPIPSGLPSLS